MTVSRRVQNAKSEKFHSGIAKRGDEALTPASKQKAKRSKTPVGPIMIGFFVFVVVGSAILQIIRSASSGL